MFGRAKFSPINPVKLVRDAQGRPAADLSKLAGHVDLLKASDEAGAALSRRGLAGIRANAVVVLDHSGSMWGDYESGAVQRLLCRILGFTLQFDADGSVPVIPFDSRVYPAVDVTVDNYTTVVQSQIWRPNQMGRTFLDEALEAVEEIAAKTTTPLYVAVLGDGGPDRQSRTTKMVCQLSRYPAFLKFVALRPVEYFSTLDKLDGSVRLLDNCNAKPDKGSNLNLLTCTDTQFQEALADEWDQWINRALAAKVLTQ